MTASLLHEVLFGLTALFAAVSCGCTVWVVFRDARWRKSGLAAQLEARVAAAESAADKALTASANWRHTTDAQVMVAQVDRNSTRVSLCEQRLEQLATKEELAHVEGAISRVEDLVRGASAGVDRIEGMLMRKALGA